LFRRWLPPGAAVFYIVALTLAFPPYNQAWAVLLFLAPLVKWAFATPRWKCFLLTGFAAGCGAWFFILIWLRHIYPPWGWLGLVLLSGYLALYLVGWLAAVRWAAPRLQGASRARRLLGLIALAGWWVVLDWLRGWLFSGFPWLPLAAAFWEFPILLQPIAWTGQWGISFLIVLFNLGLVCGTGAESSADAGAPPRKFFWPARFGVEIMVPVLLFFGAMVLAMALQHSSSRPEFPTPILRVGIVQPDIPATLKWVESEEDKNWQKLWTLTQPFTYREGSKNNVDLVLWPEAAPPFPVQGPHAAPYRKMLTQLDSTLQVPILFGAIGEAYPKSGGTKPAGDFDEVFLVRPGISVEDAKALLGKTVNLQPGALAGGFAEEFYAKRHLVPFGEYVPFRSLLPFIGQVVPFDTLPGEHAQTIPIMPQGGHILHAGPLVCYEDIFANLARDQARAGADFLVVVTNDDWFGTEGGSLQHAAHSVLRAIETRRPVVRCGNNGWSGFIDQDGDAFPLTKYDGTIQSSWILRARGTTYFQGTGILSIYVNPQFDGQETFYVRFGDWFVGLSALLALGGYLVLRKTNTIAGQI
jgi:apolipoprotein N-acyltransferase